MVGYVDNGLQILSEEEMIEFSRDKSAYRKVWEEKDIEELMIQVLEIQMLAVTFNQETAARTCEHIIRKIGELKGGKKL